MPTSQEIHYTFPMRSGVVFTMPPIDVQYPPVQDSETFDTDATNGFILNIPSGLDFAPDRVGGGGVLPIQAWGPIVAEKHAAIMAQYAGFGNSVFDDMEDASGWDSSANCSGIIFGGRGTMSLGPDGSNSTVQTLPVVLGPIPNDAALWPEAFVYVEVLGAVVTSSGYANSNSTGARFHRYFRALDDGGPWLRYDVSFNNGSTFMNDVTPRSVFNIAPVDQGSDFILRITRRTAATAPTGRIFVGGWSLVY